MNQTSTTENNLVLSQIQNHICHLILNRPKAYNSLSLGCMQALIEKIEEISNNPSVRAVILSGSGKGFCAGHDLKELKGNPDQAFYEKTFATCSKLMMSITRLNVPVIAKIHGVATAAGCQLVATCDLAVADDKSRFATPGVNIGLFCSTPMVALTRCVAPKHAMEMLLLGDLISAQRAYEIGLVNQIVPGDDLDRTVDEMALKIISKSSFTIKIGKRAFYEQAFKDRQSAYEYANKVMIENMMANDAKEGICAFMEKRKPVWTGK